MLDLQQLSEAQKAGDKQVTSLTEDEKTILVAYGDLVASEIIKMGRAKQSTTADLVRNSMLVGVQLGSQIDIHNSGIYKR
jgi:hypothetical protein